MPDRADRDPHEERAAFRRFVRDHHPDVGGDPEQFAAGVAQFRARQQSTQPPRADSRRFDAPVVGVPRSKGVRGLLNRARQWHSRRKRPPRVQ